MIRFTVLSIFLFLLNTGCHNKKCNEWYSGVELRAVSKYYNNNDHIKLWYKTDHLVYELNFWVVYIFSQDGYEECKSVTFIHDLVKPQTKLFCSGQMIIGADTLKANTNIYKYFELIELDEGNNVLRYNTPTYGFPTFASQINDFTIEIPLSDGTTISKLLTVVVN